MFNSPAGLEAYEIVEMITALPPDQARLARRVLERLCAAPAALSHQARFAWVIAELESEANPEAWLWARAFREACWLSLETIRYRDQP